MLTVMLMLRVSAFALEPVKYLDENGQEQWVTDYTVLEKPSDWNKAYRYDVELTDGWYVVNSSLYEVSDAVVKKGGDIHLIIADNCTCNISLLRIDTFAQYDTSIHVYSQSFGENMGKMKMKLANRYAFSIYNLNIYGGNFEVNDNGGGGFAFHCQSFSCWNGNIAVGNKECMDVDILKLYGGQLHCDGGLRIHSKVVFGQSVTDIVCDFSRCNGINEVFVFLGKTKDVIIEEGVTVRVGEESYTERIQEDVLTGGVFDPMRTGTLSLTSTTDDEVLSVDDISCTEPRNSGWYTLNGIRLDGKPTSAGIYIHDGRKVIVK